MSENRNRGICDYSKYDSMTTEELEQILRLDMSAPEGEESDVELQLYVMEVLANRRKKAGNTGKTAFEAWESFQQNYLCDEEECPEDTLEVKKPVKRSNPWLRRLAAAAAAIVLVVCIPLTANAFTWEELWDVIAQWAKETFSFVSGDDADVTEPDAEDNLEYTSLQDALRRNKLDTGLVPTWIPEGYVLETVEKAVTPIREIYKAYYVNGERELIIRVYNHLSTDAQNIEIEEDILEIYTVSETEYYIFENVDQLQVIWVKDSYECNISGDLSINQAKEMIDSIGKG